MSARARVIIDNDFAGDPDGLFQLAHHVLCSSIEVRLVVASRLPDAMVRAGHDPVAEGVVAADDVLALADSPLRALHGSRSAVDAGGSAGGSDATAAIVREALRDDTDLPLFYAAGAGLTELALALRAEPRIAERLTLVWIGGHGYDGTGRDDTPEFNTSADIAAAAEVFASPVTVWQVPEPTYASCVVTWSELDRDIAPLGSLGAHLVERFRTFTARIEKMSGANLGETVVLGDSPLVVLTALRASFAADATSSPSHWRPRPIIGPAGHYEGERTDAQVRVFTGIDMRLLYGDLVAKLGAHAEAAPHDAAQIAPRQHGAGQVAPHEFPPPPYIRPVGGERPIPPRGARSLEGLTYSMIPGYRPLLLDVHIPEHVERPPVVLWIHGGAWLMGDRRLPPVMWPAGILFQKIVDAGMAVAALDYRHSREAPFPAQLHDAKAALRYLRRFEGDLGIDASRVVAWGESAGAHLAALVGLTGGRPEWEGEDGVRGEDTTVSAVVDWYGVHDGERLDLRALPVDPATVPPSHAETLAQEPLLVLTAGSALGAEALRLSSPVAHVRADAPPFLVMHGEQDGLVPIAQSEYFVDAMSAVGAAVEFRRIAGADHVWQGVDPLPLMDDAIDWIGEKLGGHP